ncbi:hypothetical protein [Chryseobacterium sp. NFX27]|uniref:hypothetical protein n=1 Tax=Chryseobacterium sp. NFX27 TaxID=2819618 RepID=UPI003CF3F9B3
MSQLLQNNFKISRGKQIASTILLISSGVILYTENILDIVAVKKFFSLFSIEYDLDRAIPIFLKVKNLVYALNMAISPMIIMLILLLRMKPVRWAFIVPLYAYLNMLIGTILQALEHEIFNIWWYRTLIFIGAAATCWILSKSLKYIDANEKSEKIRDIIFENYRKQLKKDVA